MEAGPLLRLMPLLLLLLLLLLTAAPLPVRCLESETDIEDRREAGPTFNEDDQDDDDDVDERFLVSTEACYGDLGCFSITGKFFSLTNRPVVVVPDSPDDIATEFLLFTRLNPASPATLVYNDADSVLRSKFNSRLPTKLVIHGFLGNGILTWMNRIRQAMLDRIDCNVIQIGWNKGAATAYNQATSNTRVVGAVVGRMLAWLEKRFGLSRDDIHIIGFSLGGQVAGYAGERMRASGRPISRITGLDPAGPYFEGTDPIVRLDPTDAQFVDVVHTDAGLWHSGLPLFGGGFGTQSPVGHVDFFVNGGHHQPGCSSISACDHSRAPELFIATLQQSNPSAFAAFPCASGYEKFLAGECGSTCPSGGCPAMGFFADRHRAQFTDSSSSRSHYLLTGSASPYFLTHYHVSLLVSSDSSSGQYGKLLVRLSSGGHLCGPHQLPGDERQFDPRSEHRGVFGCSGAASESTPELQVSWVDESWTGTLLTHSIAMDTATLTAMVSGRVHRYCRIGAFASGDWASGSPC